MAPLDKPAMREPLEWFGYAMEEVLRENDADKGVCGWYESNIFYLVESLKNEVSELSNALYNCNPEGVKKEVIDIANFCMMIYDNITTRGKRSAT